MLKSAHVVVALSLLLLTHEAAAGAAPHLSFSHGFSSHASSSHVSAPHVTPSKSGFGAFSSRSSAATPIAPAPARAPSGSFGSFGAGAAHTQKSNSALNQQLSKNTAQANALRTLDQRNAANAAQNAPQPTPGYAQSAPIQPANAPAHPPAGPSTVIVHQDGGGLGHVLAGAMIARSAHAHAGYYPAPNYDTPSGTTQSSGGTSFFHLFVTLCLLAVIAWGIWFAWKGIRRRRAALREANKPNYSFDRN